MFNSVLSKDIDQIAYAVIGAAIEVHRELGAGYLEKVYEDALAIEFGLRGIPFVQQHSIQVQYKSRSIGEDRLDFMVADRVVVELKAVDHLLKIHEAQVLSYLKSTGCNLGILINFNVEVLKSGVRRLVLA